jgi:plastocyanin
MTTSLRSRRGWQASAAALAFVLFVLALAGIRGEIASAGAPTAQASRAARVVINHFAFHPPTLRIGAGSRVVFSNTSGTAHTATRRGSFNTGHIKPGKSVSIRFTQRGTFAYHCSIHPFMHGKIVVQ